MAVDDAQVFPGFLTPVLAQISFQSHQLLFSHASSEVRGENKPKEIWRQPGLGLISSGHESDTLTTEPPGRCWTDFNISL